MRWMRGGGAGRAGGEGPWCWACGGWGRVARAERSAPQRGPAPAAASGRPSGRPGDLFARSRGFRDLLEAVRERGVELDEREQAVAAREAALKGLEETLARREHAPRGLAGRGRRVLARGGGAPARGAAGPRRRRRAPALTKIYETMKPEEAGPIFDRLDDSDAHRRSSGA